MAKAKKTEFGDFQTPIELTDKIANFIKTVFPAPTVILEPTSGLGHFIQSCHSIWQTDCSYHGFDVNPQYIDKCAIDFKNHNNCHFEVADFFLKDWNDVFQPFQKQNKQILVIGNPPWVTNAVLGTLNSKNIPEKSNFQGLNGFAAKTGKANFDIAEWIIIKLLESLHSSNSCLAMLCKTATARKVLKHAWSCQWNVSNSSIHLIDAKKYFNVAVDACLLVTFISPDQKTNEAAIYEDVSYTKKNMQVWPDWKRNNFQYR